MSARVDELLAAINGMVGSRRTALRSAAAIGLGVALLAVPRAVAARGAADVARDAVDALNAAMATGDDAKIDALFAPDLAGHPPHRSLATGEAFSHDLAGLKAALVEMRKYFQGAAFVVEDVIAEDDKAAGRLTFRGTPDAAAFGLPQAASQPVAVGGVAFAVVGDERVKEFWAYFDEAELMALIKAGTPAP